ncbi:unnamed protein product [Amoebophrya sp. A25]|nr:unnamed protein product [Amoebophrya sp. A25]|eukprot:GSA25T00024464001.1
MQVKLRTADQFLSYPRKPNTRGRWSGRRTHAGAGQDAEHARAVDRTPNTQGWCPGRRTHTGAGQDHCVMITISKKVSSSRSTMDPSTNNTLPFVLSCHDHYLTLS